MSSPFKHTSLCFIIVAVYLLACINDNPITGSEETKGKALTVQGFTVTFDSSTMNAKLQWAASDTSLISMYAIYRKSSSGKDSMLLVENSLTSCTDDLIMADGDSVTYQIAAIGKDNLEGNKTISETIVASGLIQCIGKIDLTSITQSGVFIQQIYSDKGDILYLLIEVPGADDNKSIIKISVQGNLLSKFHHKTSGERMTLGDQLQHDDSGNLYMHAQYHSDSTGDPTRSSILKLDADLNVRAEYSLNTFIDSSSLNTESIMITGSGSVYLIVDSNPAWNHHSTVMRLTPDFKSVDTQFTIDRPLYNLSRYGDTIVTFEYYDSIYGEHTRSIPHVSCYNMEFTQLSTTVRPYLDNQYWIPSFRGLSINDEQLIGAPHGIIAALRRDDIVGSSINTQLLFTNPSGSLLARTVFKAYPEFYFDNAGHLYCCSYTEYDNLDQPKTLFIYRMAPLYTKAKSSR